MKLSAIEQIASAVLYEGYILYPYRPTALKNRQRWNFGALCPPAYKQLHPEERSESQTECLVQVAPGDERVSIHVRLRFLHVMDQRVAQVVPALSNGSLLPKDRLQFVDSLRVGLRVFQAWQEASECEIGLPEITLAQGTPAFSQACFQVD